MSADVEEFPNYVVRAWAIERGYRVGKTGFMGARIVAAFREAVEAGEAITVPTCALEGCDRRPERSPGICGMHADRIKRGTPPLQPRRVWGVPIEERRVVTEAGCWEWQGPRNPLGYGLASGHYVHRLSYERAVGPIPPGFHIDHLCRNTPCFNPEHLEAVTPRVNTLRGRSPGANAVRTNRCIRGHEFTPENTYIRRDDGYRQCRACAVLRRERRRAAR